MNTARTLAGWLLFLAMAIVAGFFWHQSADRGDYINELSNVIAQMEHQISQLSNSIDSLEKQVEQESQTIEALRARIQEADEGNTSASNENTGEKDALSFGNILDALMQSGDSETSDMSVLGSMMNMLKSPQGEKMLEAGVNMTVNMQYADFFNLLAPETVETARKIIGNFMTRTARYGIDFMNGGDDANLDTAKNTMESERAAMLAELKNAIGDDGVALFEQYEQELPGKMMDQALEMQLGMFAQGLSAETQDMVRQTLVEELLAAQPDNGATTSSTLATQTMMETQGEAYNRALERLSLQVTEDEYAVVERFVQQQQQMVNMFSTMMMPDKENK